uniref:THIF-type NAD/FAD binding fold domain-containing protein n=1 Tax=Haptolina ericina TaxID=156174 RepID=A0A7S3B1H5_9EUKA
MSKNKAELDVKRYDRQIRLWGMDTQRAMLGARILVLEFTGLGNEIVKNLVLAGVGHVCIQDAGLVTEDDVGVGGVFSITKAHVGKSRADAAVEQLHPMNPQVDLTACTKEARLLDAEFLRSYDLIVGTGGVQSVRDLIAADEKLCGGEGETGRETSQAKRARTSAAPDAASKPAKGSNGSHVVLGMRTRHATAGEGEGGPHLLSSGTIGMHGFCFLDLGRLAYRQEDKVQTAAVDPEAEPRAQSSAGSDAETKTVSVMRVLYPSLSAATSVEWTSLTKRVPRFYCALQLLLEHPDAQVEKLLSAKERRLKDGGLSDTFLASPLDDAFVRQVAATAKAELSPICAVVGGIVAAEVIKIISGKEAPINNAFFFDGASGDGVVQRVGPSFNTPWGMDSGVPRKME